MRTLFEQDFEKGMVAFREARDTDTPAFLRAMALYFADFDITPRSLYLELITALRDARHTTTLATTNYEILIERAVSRVGLRVVYQGDVAVPDGHMRVLKIHGSCNFLPNLGGVHLHGVKMSAPPTVPFVRGSIRAAATRNEVIEFCRREDSLAPAIAVYAPGKTILFTGEFIQQQQAQWRNEAKRADVIYVIGLRVMGEDDHIWGPLATTQGRIEYVGGEPDDVLGWAKERGRSVNVLALTFEKAMPLIRAQLHD
jgi:hypothetical protein